MLSDKQHTKKEIGKALQAARKRAGYKSAKAFAEHMGLNVSTYTDYEQGRLMFTLNQAWEFADALGCTLDSLAGRKAPVTSSQYSDYDQERLNGYYESMNSLGKEQLVNTAQLMAGSPAVRFEKNRQERPAVDSTMGA